MILSNVMHIARISYFPNVLHC